MIALFIMMHAAGMPSVGKHFPGHGCVGFDSHTSRPISDKSEKQLKEIDLRPFVHLIEKNLLNAVMPGHVTYTDIDPDHPAGFSKIWLQDILRAQYNFHGLIISDCLSMDGADIGNMQMRATQALDAGCDMLILCNQTRELLLEVLQTITFAQTHASEQRIAAFKSNMMRFSQHNVRNSTSFASNVGLFAQTQPTAAIEMSTKSSDFTPNINASLSSRK